MNALPYILVGLIVAAAAVAAGAKLIRALRGKGGCSCDRDEASCPAKSFCRKKL